MGDRQFRLFLCGVCIRDSLASATAQQVNDEQRGVAQYVKGAWPLKIPPLFVHFRHHSLFSFLNILFFVFIYGNILLALSSSPSCVRPLAIMMIIVNLIFIRSEMRISMEKAKSKS